MSRPTKLVQNGTLYWTIRLYNSSGALVDADSTPTVTIRKNGVATVDSVTVSKRAATTGIYDCSYNPAGEAEGDIFTVEESATISSTTYQSGWEFSVETSVQTVLNRIGAFTGTGVNTILGFLKAIMFSDVSTPSDAGDTFSSSLEVLAGASAPSTSEIATAVWSNSTRTLSAGAEETYEDRTTSSKIVYYIGELIEKTVTAQEDLSSKTLEICFQVIGSDTDIVVIPDGNITVGGAGNKEVTFTNTAAITASVQKLRFSVRDTTSKKVYIQGDAEIRDAPLAD